MDAFRKNILLFATILATLLLPLAALAASTPNAPSTLIVESSSTFDQNNYPAKPVDALAGNITQLTLTAISQTRAWQGYWGNVSGTITLDDASNYTFYNWSAAEPRGYIYATLVSAGVPSWLNVQCFDKANNASLFDQYYGINPDDYDNVTNTYNTTLDALPAPQTVYIVNNSFTTCPATTIWQSDAYQPGNFVNYLMYDSSAAQGNQSWVFGTVIENKNIGNKTDIPCYNGQLCDFQLLVGENGHGTNTGVTPYYVWVDLSG